MTRLRVTLMLFFVAVGFAVLAPGAQGQDSDTAELSIYRVYVDDRADIEFLSSTGFDLLEARGQNYVLIIGDGETAAKLEGEGFRVRADRPLDPVEGTTDFNASTYNGGYRTVDEHYRNLNVVQARFPDLAVVVDYGDSWRAANGQPGGNELLAICITKLQPGDCALDPAAPKPRAVIMAAIHARELQTSEIAWRLIDELTRGYGDDADISYILDTTEVWIIPVANPDGREIAELGGNAPYLQRKNANDSLGNCATPPLWYNQSGVDLNRNASHGWGGAGTSPDPCAQTYPGTASASEPEQVALESLFRSLWPDQKGAVDSPVADTATGVFISLHSYSNLILFPSAPVGNPLNDTQLRTFAFRMSHFNQYTAGTGDEILYPASGTTDDWTYYKLGVASYTYELSPQFGTCSGFTPPYACIDSQLWPRNRDALIYSLKVAGAPYVEPLGPTTLSVSAPARISNAMASSVSAAVSDDALGDTAQSVGRPAARTITGAEFYIDVGPDEGGVAYPMVAADGSFDSPSEDLIGAVGGSELSVGQHMLLVRARNADNSWGPLTAAAIEVFDGHDIVSPADGSSLCAGDTIDWDGPDSGKYRLRIGTTPDGNDVLNQATANTDLTIGAVPPGETLYATLRHRPAGTTTWIVHDFAVYAPCAP